MRFGIWYFQNSAALSDADSDPVQNLIEIWLGVRWAFLGMALYGVSWLWSLSTNVAILRSARPAASPEKPPVLS